MHAPTVEAKATPAGWVPVDYGSAQLSVPATWRVSTDDCAAANAPGTIILVTPGSMGMETGTVPSSCAPNQSAPVTAPVMEVGPIRTALSSGPARTQRRINGLDVQAVAAEPCKRSSAPCPTWYDVPALGVEIFDAEAPDEPDAVLDTLTFSPRAVALAPGKMSAAPTSWQEVGFGGITAEVPSTWPIRTNTNWMLGCEVPDLTMAEAVNLDAGSRVIAQFCQAIVPGGQPAQPPMDGLVIDPGTYGPLSSTTTYGRCFPIDALTVCPSTSDRYGILVLAVHLPGRSAPVAVEIGLAGDGMVARTVLDSLRASPAMSGDHRDVDPKQKNRPWARGVADDGPGRRHLSLARRLGRESGGRRRTGRTSLALEHDVVGGDRFSPGREFRRPRELHIEMITDVEAIVMPVVGQRDHDGPG